MSEPVPILPAWPTKNCFKASILSSESMLWAWPGRIQSPSVEQGPRARSRLTGQEGRAQLTARFTRAAIRSSSAEVSSVSAKSVGHMVPSSRFALLLNPSVAYRVLNSSVRMLLDLADSIYSLRSSVLTFEKECLDG
jgi:hypothetical protein